MKQSNESSELYESFEEVEQIGGIQNLRNDQVNTSQNSEIKFPQEVYSSRENQYEHLLQSLASTRDWILHTSFESCFDEIHYHVLHNELTKKKNLKRSVSSKASKPEKSRTTAEPQRTVKKKTAPKARQVRHFHGYEVSEGEIIQMENYFGVKLARDIISMADQLVSFQRYWRANRKYRFTSNIQDLKSMMQTTVVEMERAREEKCDITDYRRQKIYIASQFCKEMDPNRPYIPRKHKSKQEKKLDKHSFLHRKEEPSFLRKVKKKNSVKTTPKQSPESQHSPIQEPSIGSTTPIRSPSIPSPNSAFSVKSANNSQISRNSSVNSPTHEIEAPHQPTKQSLTNIKKGLSTRVFKLRERTSANLDLVAAKLQFGLEVENNNEQHISNEENEENGRERASEFNPIEKTVLEEEDTLLQKENLNSNNFSELPRNQHESFLYEDKQTSPSEYDGSRNDRDNIRSVSPIMRRAPPPPQSDLDSMNGDNEQSLEEMFTAFERTFNEFPQREEEIRDELKISHSKQESHQNVKEILSPFYNEGDIVAEPTPPKSVRQTPPSKVNSNSDTQATSSTPKPPTRKPPQPKPTLEDLIENDRKKFADIDKLCFNTDTSSIVFQFDRHFVYSGFKQAGEQ